MQQNRIIQATDDDNFTDIAIRYTQNAENAFLIAELNGMNIDDTIPSGTEIALPLVSETPVAIVSTPTHDAEPSPSALLELIKQHSSRIASTHQLGHVRSGDQIKVNDDGTMEVVGESHVSALMELITQHANKLADSQHLGHVKSGDQIRVNPDGTMEIIGGLPELSIEDVLNNCILNIGWQNSNEIIWNELGKLPVGFEEKYSVRNGYLSYKLPKVVNGGLIWNGSEFLIEIEKILNLYIGVSNFEDIEDHTPMLLITRYKPSSYKSNWRNTRKRWRISGYRHNIGEDEWLKPAFIDIPSGNFIVDIGQEYYFRKRIGDADKDSVAYSVDDFLQGAFKFVDSRGMNRRYCSKQVMEFLSPMASEFKGEKYYTRYSSFVYLEFRLAIMYKDTELIISNSCFRLKMSLNIDVDDAPTQRKEYYGFIASKLERKEFPFQIIKSEIKFKYV